MRPIEESVVPRPRTADPGEDTLDLRRVTAVSHPDDASSRRGARRVADLLEAELGLEVPTTTDSPSGPVVRVDGTAAVEGSTSEEGYRLAVEADAVRLSAPTSAGLHYGGQTLVQLASCEDSEIALPTGLIRDWPASEWRGFMADPARGFVPLDALEALVDRLARAKLNVLHLHLVDSQSWRLELENYPALAGGISAEYEGTYTKAEMEQLVAYAADRDVTVVPEIDVPGHGLRLLQQVPELRCDTGSAKRAFDKKSAICIGQDRTYEFLEDVVGEVVEVFPSEVVHVGGDEWSHRGVSWTDCERCQRRMADLGLESVRELYYYFLRRMHGVLENHDRRLMLWNDEVDLTDSPDLPRDVLVQFWVGFTASEATVADQAANGMQEFIEAGFEVVNSRTSATYANSLQRDILPSWNPTRLPHVEPEAESGVLGGELCAWHGWRDEFWTRYYRRALPSMLPVFGDRVWNGTEIGDDAAFSRAVTRHVLGPSTPPEFDLYEALGGVLLPTSADEKHAGLEWADVTSVLSEHTVPAAIERAEAAQATLESLESRELPPPPEVSSTYREVLAWLVEDLDRERRGDQTQPDPPFGERDDT